MRIRVPDECPYRRPFQADFDDCPAFTASEFVALDLQHRPLPSVLTCQHLAVGQGSSPGSHYARCRIGDAAARAGWIAQVNTARLEALREISSESRTAFHDHLGRLWEAKGATLRDVNDPAAQHELRRASELFVQVAETFYRSHSAQLAAAGLPLEPTVALIRRVMADFIDSPSASVEIPEEYLQGLPAETRLLLRPE